MHTTVNFSSFVDAFRSMGRGGHFSYEGSRVLFDFLEQLEFDMGTSIDLDVIGLCCYYHELTAKEVVEDYSIHLEDGASDEEIVSTVRNYLENNTTICGELPGGVFVFAEF